MEGEPHVYQRTTQLERYHDSLAGRQHAASSPVASAGVPGPAQAAGGPSGVSPGVAALLAGLRLGRALGVQPAITEEEEDGRGRRVAPPQACEPPT